MTRADFVFLGQNTMGGSALRHLVDCGWPPQLVLTRLSSEHHNEVAAVAAAADLELVRLRALNNNEPVLEQLRRFRPTVGVCCGWSERLGSPLLRIPTQGWINLHPSGLPNWRGSDPIGWQLVSGVPNLSCTIHWMDEQFDRGPIIATARVPADATTNGFSARETLGRALGALVVESLENITAGRELDSIPQDERFATSCPPRGVVPMVVPAIIRGYQLTRVIAAFSPYPGVGIEGLPIGFRAIAPTQRLPASSVNALGSLELLDGGRRAELHCLDSVVRFALRET